MNIRLAHPEEQAALAGIHKRARQKAYRGLLPDRVLDDLPLDAWVEERRRYLAQHRELRTWVATGNDRLLGFSDTAAASDADLPSDAAEVLLLYLEPEALGLGVGHSLFAHAVADLKERGFGPLVLWTLQDNARAQAFYERQGWRADGATRPWSWRGEELSREVRYRSE